MNVIHHTAQALAMRIHIYTYIHTQRDSILFPHKKQNKTNFFIFSGLRTCIYINVEAGSFFTITLLSDIQYLYDTVKKLHGRYYYYYFIRRLLRSPSRIIRILSQFNRTNTFTSSFSTIHTNIGSRDSSVGIVTGLRAGRPKSRGSIPDSGQEIFQI
jgi:hypothetical protein